MSVSEFESDSSKENKKPISHKGMNDSIFRDDAIIDMEIEQIEMEMSRLSLKLESLKLEKAKKREMKIIEKPSKNPKQGFLKVQDSKQLRRGLSLCPAEIYSSTKSGHVSSHSSGVSVKQNSTRRQSCFWEPGQIDELKLTKKAVKQDDVVKANFQPKRLFRDVERPSSSSSVSSLQRKPPIQSSRVVASRFNTSSQSLSMDGGIGKLRSLSLGGAESGRVKKRWEIPARGEVVVYKNDRESTPVIDEIDDNMMLPKVRTLRCVKQ